MGADTNTPYTLPAELKKEYKLDLIKDEMSSSLTTSERNTADRELADLLRNPELTREQIEKLLDARLAIDSEPVKLSGSNSSDAQTDTGKSAGPSLESTIATGQMAGLAAALGLAPDVARAAMEAGQKYVQYVTRASESTAAQNDIQTSNTLAAANQYPLNQDPNKTVAAETAPAAAPIADTLADERKEKKAKENLAQEMKDSATRADALTTALDRNNIDNGVASLSKTGVEQAAENPRKTAAKVLREAPDNNPELAQKVEENGHIPIPGTLVIRDMSPANTGRLSPSQPTGKVPVTGVSRGPSTA